MTNTVIRVILFLLIVFSFPALVEPVSKFDLDQFYWDADFGRIVDHFQKLEYQSLSMDEKLLFIECLARTGRNNLAGEKIKQIKIEPRYRSRIYASAGWVFLSSGLLNQAKDILEKSLELSPDGHNALLAKMLLFLYLKQYEKAVKLLEQFLENNPDLENSFQVFLIGMEIFNAVRDLPKLYRWYKKRADWMKKRDKQTAASLKASAQLYKGIRKKNLFEIVSNSDTISLPFAGKPGSRFFCVNVKIGNSRKFRIILDTGNATGWLVHDRELYDNLTIKEGGRTTAIIGTEAQSLDGYRIYTETLPFDSFQIDHLTGVYIPKPRIDFFDGNLNPIFIRNRVISLDGKRKCLVLRTKEAFHRYLTALRPAMYSRLPWYGYEQVFLPVTVNLEENGLGIVETGAEDIAIKLSFARILHLPMKSKVRYLSNGKVYRFFEAPVSVSLGQWRLDRKNAEVWSFKRFYRRLSGLTADVVLGPQVFRDNWIVSFDPFSRQIFLEGPGH
jgi:tetratricopeptide (TPR) repeat protein